MAGYWDQLVLVIFQKGTDFIEMRNLVKKDMTCEINQSLYRNVFAPASSQRLTRSHEFAVALRAGLMSRVLRLTPVFYFVFIIGISGQ